MVVLATENFRKGGEKEFDAYSCGFFESQRLGGH